MNTLGLDPLLFAVCFFQSGGVRDIGFVDIWGLVGSSSVCKVFPGVAQLAMPHQRGLVRTRLFRWHAEGAMVNTRETGAL